MPKYATGTEVPISRSREEIETILRRYGATGFGYLADDAALAALIVFRIKERQYRIRLTLPTPTDPSVRARGSNQYHAAGDPKPGAYEAEIRRRWRALALYIKATLEAVESGISTLEEILISHALISPTVTVGEWAEDNLTEAYATGQMPRFLPGVPPPRQLPPGRT